MSETNRIGSIKLQKNVTTLNDYLRKLSNYSAWLTLMWETISEITGLGKWTKQTLEQGLEQYYVLKMDGLAFFF